MAQILKNNVSGVLGLALSASGTSMTLLDASNFPTPTGGDFYLLTLIGLNANGQEASWEVVKVTAKASNTLTIVRAQEGTAAAAWPVATTVQLRLTAGSVVTPGTVSDHVGSGGSTHAAATTSTAGFMSATDKTKLDGVEAGANAYTHPTGDGNLHVPATGTTNSGKVLTAGASAGSLSWVAPLALGSTAGTALGTAAAGTATTAARSDHVHPVQTSVSGNAGTATKLETARTINGVSFDGSANITINAVDSTARELAITAGTTAQYWRGDKSWQALNKSAVGLGNVDNTSDASKPISTAVQTALNAKQDTLVSGTNIKTLNGESLLGAGNLVLQLAADQPSAVTYAYDASGRVETTTETLPTGTRTTTVTYNEAGQVKTVAVTLGTSTRTTQYAYDQYGVLTGTTSTES